MTARKTLLLASATALVGVPVWAVSSDASPGNGHAPSATPPGQTKDADEHGSSHGKPATPGKSHKCKPHGVAFVLSGLLEGQTLVPNLDGTYTGEVKLSKITQTNHHAKTAKSPFTLTSVHVSFDLADTNADGSVGLDDLAVGDTVKLIGKLATTAKKCGTFTASPTFRKVIFSTP
jgi:hypothetical protein